MNRFKRAGGGRVGAHLLWILALLLVTSCGRAERSQKGIAEVTPLPDETPSVAYGASLSEWEDAAASDAEGSVGNTPEDSALSESDEEDIVAAAEEEVASEIGVPFTFDDQIYREIMWDGLLPAEYSAEAIMAKYSDELSAISDGSPEAAELYSKMQEEFNNAPINEVLDSTLVRLPGFIAPLNYDNDIITEFLLVPYFGACIHVPPPPVNQTVLVNAAEGQGIKIEDSYNPIWVMGKLSTEGATTLLANAGYSIQGAYIEPYTFTLDN